MARYGYALKFPTANAYIPSNYTIISWSPTCLTPGGVICAIYAVAGNTGPLSGQFSSGENLYDYITDALTDPFTPQTDGFGQKVYVYTTLIHLILLTISEPI